MFCLMLEVESFAFLQGLNFFRPNLFVHGFVDRHFDSITDDYRKAFVEEGQYDAALGWDNVPSTTWQDKNRLGEVITYSYDADGSRADNLPPKQLLITTYGDSYTNSDEVENHETWQYFLESRIGYEVKNFGVSGYGTDQAVLKLEKHLAHGFSAPLVILGILDENINRVVTSFYPLYAETTGATLAFKPSFRVAADGHVQMIPNPYGRPELTLQNLREMAHRTAEQDFWVRTTGKIDIRFPYTYQVVRVTSVVAGRKIRDWSDSPSHVDSVNLWETAEGSAVMHHLIDRFVELTSQSHAIPLVLFIPRGERLRTNERRYGRFADEIRARHTGLYVVDLMDHDFDKERFQIRPYDGHASAYGNEVIARLIEQTYEDIKKEHEIAPVSTLTQ